QGGAEGILVPSGQLSPTDDHAEVKQFREELMATDSDATPSANALQAWAAAKMLYHQMATIEGEITAASVLEAMSSITTPPTEVFGPMYDTTEDQPFADNNRLFNTNAFEYVVRDGEIVRKRPEAISLNEVLETALAE
ncbi:MAG TPA: hypothetical protein VF183_05215, partial [Acidimicrobiales bacterium]